VTHFRELIVLGKVLSCFFFSWSLHAIKDSTVEPLLCEHLGTKGCP